MSPCLGPLEDVHNPCASSSSCFARILRDTVLQDCHHHLYVSWKQWMWQSMQFWEGIWGCDKLCNFERVFGVQEERQWEWDKKMVTEKLTRYETPFCVAELETVWEHMLNMKTLLHLKLPITYFPAGQRQSWESVKVPDGSKDTFPLVDAEIWLLYRFNFESEMTTNMICFLILRFHSAPIYPK